MSVFHCARHLDLNCEIYVTVVLFFYRNKSMTYFIVCPVVLQEFLYAGEFWLQVRSINITEATYFLTYLYADTFGLISPGFEIHVS